MDMDSGTRRSTSDFNQTVIGDRGGIVAGVTQIAADVIQLFVSFRDSLHAQRDQRDRRTALARVDARIRELVDLSPGMARISLRLRPVGTTIAPPIESAPFDEKVREELMAAEGSLWPAFEAKGGSLLLLGEPGAGKTGLLLDLAREAITRAIKKTESSIPMFFPLSEWDGDASLVDWLVEAIYRHYRIPPRIGRSWIRDGRLALILDGLDEVRHDRQAGCVRAINRFVHDHGLTPTAVSCRAADYRAMKEPLELCYALEVEPLTFDQMNDCLERSQPSFGWTRILLAEDPILSELARTPLMLRVIAVAYAERHAESVTNSPLPAERRAQIFDAYVERMLGHNLREKPEKVADILGPIRRLARKMRESGRTLFEMEQIQPTWLDRGLSAYSAMVGAATFLLLGLPVLVAALWYFLHHTDQFDWEAIGGMVVLLLLTFGLPAGLASRRIRTIEVVRWSWRKGGACLLGLPGAMIMGALLDAGNRSSLYLTGFYGLVGGLAFGFASSLRLRITHVGASTLGGGVGGVLWGLGVWLVNPLSTHIVDPSRPHVHTLITAAWLAPLALLFGGLEFSELETKLGFNVGIKRTLSNATKMSILATFTLFSTYRLSGWFTSSSNFVPQASLDFLFLTFSIPVGVFTFLALGGFSVIKHYSLRLVLAAQGELPLRLSRFLDFASRKVLLRRIGDGWMFLHPSLLEHFASKT